MSDAQRSDRLFRVGSSMALVLAALGGFIFVQPDVSQVASRVEQDRGRLRSDDVVLSTRDAIARERARLLRRHRAIAEGQSQRDLLDKLELVARTHSVQIISVEMASISSSRLPQIAGDSDPEEAPLHVELRGSYRALLTSLDMLAHVGDSVRFDAPSFHWEGTTVGASVPIFIIRARIQPEFSSAKTAYLKESATGRSSRRDDAGRARPRLAELIRRDPFDGAPRPVAAAIPSSISELPDFTFGADDEERTATPAPSVLQLRATIVGASPVAYVVDGQTMHVVAPGDHLGSRRVTEIDATGVVFDDGTRLELSGNSGPVAKPTTARGLRPSRTTRETTASYPVATTAPTARAEPVPTPAPLPTIKPGAFPLGSSPTSDPNAPTPFPYPYAYPPK
jgi:hypothetical protein